ncbi:hypothetical protein M2447_001863 [Ereboglobus sp. PH5-10]|nr:hypothetical protein [Ereboglobus sp. PH5-10]
MCARFRTLSSLGNSPLDGHYLRFHSLGNSPLDGHYPNSSKLLRPYYAKVSTTYTILSFSTS